MDKPVRTNHIPEAEITKMAETWKIDIEDCAPKSKFNTQMKKRKKHQNSWDFFNKYFHFTSVDK